MVVIDANIFMGACLGTCASSRKVEACLTRHLQPLTAAALLAEYEDVLGRSAYSQKVG